MSTGHILHLFGGKGGAGKTTLSTAFAFNLSESDEKAKVLLVAPDSTGSFSELFKKKVGAQPTKLLPGKGEGGLYVAELSLESARDEFTKKYAPLLSQVVVKGKIIGEQDLMSILEQGFKGLDELLVLFRVQELLESKEFARVVVDLGSTSHVLRYFELPGAFRRFVGLARGEKSKGATKKDAVRPGLDELVNKIESLIAFLTDASKTTLHLVALPEPVGETHTRQLFLGAREKNIQISEIIANQVEEASGCPTCFGRRGLQAPHVRKFQQLDKAVPVVLLGKREVQPRGLEGIKKLAKEWLSNKETKTLEFAAAEGPPALVRAPSMAPIAAPPITPTRLIFFVGHGGVGKSSCAAAAAVTLTEKEGPVLLLSTDTTHSLSDVLQGRLTDTETQVKGTKGLYARELDSAHWFSNVRKRWKERLESAFGPEVKGQDVPYDREILKNLLDAAPLAIDELGALCALTDALVQERFKRIVVDPMPTSSSMRLLELPPLAREWLSAILSVLVKYKTKGLGDLADEIAAMLKHVKRFEEALISPEEARFIVVTRGDELATARTEQLVDYLKSKNVHVERVLVNRVQPKATCEKCENRRKNELNAAKLLEKKLGVPLTLAPALGRFPAGLRELKAFRTSWYALTATTKVKAA